MVSGAANAEQSREFHAELRLLEKALRRIVRAHDMQSRALAKSSGLTAAQLVVCKGIVELGEVTSAALSAYADISPATVVTILDNLEERGVIQRYRSLTDRRIVHTRLTDIGRGLVQHAPEPLSRTLTERLRNLGADERASLIDSVDMVSRMMEPPRPEQSQARG